MSTTAPDPAPTAVGTSDDPLTDDASDPGPDPVRAAGTDSDAGAASDGGGWLELERRAYRPSGRVSWPRFLAWGALPLGLALVGAFLLHLFSLSGFYVPGVAPMIAALGLLFVVLLAVGRGHCRHTGWAFGLGSATYAVLFAGFHALGMAYHFATFDPGRLPEFLGWYVAHLEGGLFTGFAFSDEPLPSVDQAFNWTMLVFEVVIGLGFCALPARERVRRCPYCERCSTWAERAELAFPPGSAPEVLRAAAGGRLARVLRQLRFDRSPDQPALLAALDLCTRGAACRAEPRAWLSLRSQARKTGELSPFHPLETLIAPFILRAAVLEPDQGGNLVALVREDGEHTP